MSLLDRIPRDRLLAIVAGLCVVLLVGDRLILTPLLAGWNERQAQIDALELTVAQDQALVDQADRWRRIEREAAAKRLPATRSDAESELIGAVDAWARAAGLTLTSIRPRWHDATGQDGRGQVQRARLELQLGGEGSAGAVASFLHAAETAPMAVAVERLELSPAEANGRRLNLEIRISGLLGDTPGPTRKDAQ